MHPEYGQDDISGITLALSNYYRTSLNKGKNTLTVKQELSNMESYLNIQQIMHDNSFDVVMDIDENVLEYESLYLNYGCKSTYYSLKNSLLIEKTD